MWTSAVRLPPGVMTVHVVSPCGCAAIPLQLVAEGAPPSVTTVAGASAFPASTQVRDGAASLAGASSVGVAASAGPAGSGAALELDAAEQPAATTNSSPA